MRKFFGALIIILLLIAIVFFVFGNVQSYTEEFNANISDEYMGYYECRVDGDKVYLLTDDLSKNEILLNDVEDLHGLSLAKIKDKDKFYVFMDFKKFNVFFEKRTIISGRLLESSESEVYKMSGINLLQDAEIKSFMQSFDHNLAVFE